MLYLQYLDQRVDEYTRTKHVNQQTKRHRQRSMHGWQIHVYAISNCFGARQCQHMIFPDTLCHATLILLSTVRRWRYTSSVRFQVCLERI